MQESVKKEETRRKKERLGKGAGGRRARLLWLSGELLWLAAGYLLGGARLPFDTLPLGPGLLCAVPTHRVAVYLGLVWSALVDQTGPWVYITVVTVVLVLSLVMGSLREEAREPLPPGLSGKLEAAQRSRGRQRKAKKDSRAGALLRALFSEERTLRMCLAALSALALGMGRLVAGGFQYYDLFATVFAVLLTPLLVPLLTPGIAGGREFSPTVCRISLFVLLAAAVWAGKDITLLTLPAAVILATALTLYAVTLGRVWGTVGGILFGAVYAPMMAPGFLLLSLVASFFREEKGRSYGQPLGVLAMSVWALYVGGITGFLYLLPAGLLGSVLFGLYQRLTAVPRPPEADKEGEEKEDPWSLQREQHTDATRRFRSISEAFSSLSEVFYDLSDRLRRPGVLDLRRICDDAFSVHCADCPNHSLCWGLEYARTLDQVNRLISSLHTKGRVEKGLLGEALLERCPRIEPILELINRDCARLTGEMLNNRTRILAMDYQAASAIINDALEEENGEYGADRELEGRIGVYLADAGIGFAGITVWGKRHRQIVVRRVDFERAGVTPETLRSDLSELCGICLELPAFRVEGGGHTMVLRTREKLAVTGAHRCIGHESGVSGDSVELFSNQKAYFYALLCDGMGSGEEAAFTSGLCAVFLQKMLHAGNRAGTSLRLLNNMICSRETSSLKECSSTVDLLELDLITGEGRFYKSGACPTFILRGGIIHRLRAGTAPIGILPGVEASASSYALLPGDTVVMVSDGILADDPEGDALAAYLAGTGSLTPKQITAEISRQAAARGIRDDTTVIALRVEKK